MRLFKERDKTNAYLEDEDVRLMLDFKNGNTASFDLLLKKYFPLIMNFIYKFVGNGSIAEDLTQEVFMRVYKSADKYAAKSKFNTWVYTIARNLSLNEARRMKRQNVSLDAPVTFGGETYLIERPDEKAVRPDENLIHSETVSEVRGAISALPERQRTAIILLRYEELSYRQISKVMAISEKAVKSLIQRGRENLKSSLLVLRDRGKRPRTFSLFLCLI